MPNIQIRGSQIQGESVEPSNINLSGSFDFRAASDIQITTKAEADNSTFPASTAYVHTIISGSLIDGFQGGDGISIDTSTSPDTIAVDLAANKGLEFSSAELQIKLDGASLALGANGISIATGGVSNAALADGAVNNAKIASDAAIANSKLANSTISGVALGSNLNSLSAGNGLSMTSYNGSAAVSNLTIDLDGSTLAVGADGLKIATNGVGGNEIAANGVATANIADSAVSTAKIGNLQVSTAKVAASAITPEKLSFQSQADTFSPDGSTAAFNLSQEVPGNFDLMVMAFKNGLLQRLVESSPANADEYTVGTTGGTTTITFGANLNANDELEVRYLA